MRGFSKREQVFRWVLYSFWAHESSEPLGIWQKKGENTAAVKKTCNHLLQNTMRDENTIYMVLQRYLIVLLFSSYYTDNSLQYFLLRSQTNRPFCICIALQQH